MAGNVIYWWRLLTLGHHALARQLMAVNMKVFFLTMSLSLCILFTFYPRNVDQKRQRKIKVSYIFSHF